MSRLKIFSFGFLAFIAMISATIFLVGKGRDADGKKDGLKYKEFTVERGTFQSIVNAEGVVKPINRIEIKSKASGQIASLPIEEGAFVRKGELIARLDQKDEQSAVSLAKADLVIADAELKQAQRMFNRRKELFRKRIISEEEHDEIGLKLAVAKGKLVQASTALERAKERLEDAVVLSPIDGIILQKYVEEGQIISSGVSSVSGGTPIADIAAMQSVYIEAGIDEIDIGKLQIGQIADVVAEAYPELNFKGKVVRIAPEARVEENVTLFDVIVEVGNIEEKLKSGMNAAIEITVLKKEAILLTPVITFLGEQGEASAPNRREVLLKKGDAFFAQEVMVGLYDFTQAEVLSGLSEGDIIGVPIQSRLKDDNDRLEKRIKRSRSFGAGAKKKPKQKPN